MFRKQISKTLKSLKKISPLGLTLSSTLLYKTDNNLTQVKVEEKKIEEKKIIKKTASSLAVFISEAMDMIFSVLLSKLISTFISSFFDKEKSPYLEEDITGYTFDIITIVSNLFNFSLGRKFEGLEIIKNDDTNPTEVDMLKRSLFAYLDIAMVSYNMKCSHESKFVKFYETYLGILLLAVDIGSVILKQKYIGDFIADTKYVKK
eukprot:gene2143-2009_t